MKREAGRGPVSALFSAAVGDVCFSFFRRKLAVLPSWVVQVK